MRDRILVRIRDRIRDRATDETPLRAMGAFMAERMADSGTDVVTNLVRWRRTLGDSAVLQSRMRLRNGSKTRWPPNWLGRPAKIGTRPGPESPPPSSS
jgi:hypothetical protein